MVYFKEIPEIKFGKLRKFKDPHPDSDSESYGANTPPFEDTELFPGADNLRFGYVKNYCRVETFIKQVEHSEGPSGAGMAGIILGGIFINPIVFLGLTPSKVVVDEVWMRRICNYSIYDRSTGELIDTVDAIVYEGKNDEMTKALWKDKQAEYIGAQGSNQDHPQGEDDFDDFVEEYLEKKHQNSDLGLSEDTSKIGPKADPEDRYYEFTLYAADPNILDNVDELYLIPRVNIEGKNGYFTEFSQTKLNIGQPITAKQLKKVLIGSKQTMKVRDDCIYIPEIIEPQGQPRRHARNLKMGIIPNTQYKVYFKTSKK